MTYVVVELCVDCKYTDCAAVCPVEAFHELPDRLYINADTCIDCDACVPECPVEASSPTPMCLKTMHTGPDQYR
jgi:ferredoxin